MIKLFFVLFVVLGFIVFPVYGQLTIKRVFFLQSGQYTGSSGIPICCDSDHNGRNEIIFQTAIPTRWEVWEHYLMNQYKLMFADTGAYPGPPGITTGNLRPYDVGDVDIDSLTDLVGPNIDESVNHDTGYNVVSTQESPNYSNYPSSLTWWYRHSYNRPQAPPFYFPCDLDHDNHKEIVFLSETGITYIFENSINNHNDSVWSQFQVGAWSFAFDDFDLDSLKNFATTDLGSSGRVSVYENIGDNQYERTYQDTVHLPNGIDVFSGNDLDGDGKPEFFVAFYSYGNSTFYLYMWEAIDNNTYQRTLVDQKTIAVGYSTGRRSKCGDLDGDGIEELVWATPTKLYVYKATGNNQFQQVWQWNQGHGINECLIVNIYDMNKNGYNEIVVGGSGKTSIFEVEAVRLLRPNGGEVFQDSTQELIRWQKFYPPRCDSLSLFYTTDNGRTYLPLASCLPASDTSFLWTVPSVNSDSCKIKIIAYGPGWQYDESDGVFSISSTGIEEYSPLSALRYSLKVERRINPTATIFSIPSFQRVNLKLYDINGRLIKSLVNETKEAGIYKIDLNTKSLPSGVYLIYLDTESKRIIERIVIVK